MNLLKRGFVCLSDEERSKLPGLDSRNLTALSASISRPGHRRARILSNVADPGRRLPDWERPCSALHTPGTGAVGALIKKSFNAPFLFSRVVRASPRSRSSTPYLSPTA